MVILTSDKADFKLKTVITEKEGHYISIKSEVKVKVIQSHLTLCDPMEYTVRGILQVRLLDWVAILFSRGSSQPRD